MRRFIFFILLLIPVASFAGHQQIQEVTAEGVGKNEREAVKDAFRNAIEDSIGLYVDSETKLQNDQLISDNILTSSKGYIHKYRLLSVKNEGGMTKVEIKALVKIQDVKSKLIGLNISTITADDSANIHARLSSKLARSQDADKILKKELDNFFDPKNVLELLDIKLTGYKIRENELAQDNTVPYEVSFEISINSDNYNEKINKLSKVFNNLGGTLKKSLPLSIAKDVYNNDYVVFKKNQYNKYADELKGLKSNDFYSIPKTVCFGLTKIVGDKYSLEHYCFPPEWRYIYPWNDHYSFGLLGKLKELEVTIQFLSEAGVLFQEKPPFNKYSGLNTDILYVFGCCWEPDGDLDLNSGIHYQLRYLTSLNFGPFFEFSTRTRPSVSITYVGRINVDLLYDIQKVEVKLGIKKQ